MNNELSRPGIASIAREENDLVSKDVAELERQKIAAEIARLHADNDKLVYEARRFTRFWVTFIPFVSVISALAIGAITATVSYFSARALKGFEKRQLELQNDTLASQNQHEDQRLALVKEDQDDQKNHRAQSRINERAFQTAQVALQEKQYRLQAALHSDSLRAVEADRFKSAFDMATDSTKGDARRVSGIWVLSDYWETGRANPRLSDEEKQEYHDIVSTSQMRIARTLAAILVEDNVNTPVRDQAVNAIDKAFGDGGNASQESHLAHILFGYFNVTGDEQPHWGAVSEVNESAYFDVLNPIGITAYKATVVYDAKSEALTKIISYCSNHLAHTEFSYCDLGNCNMAHCNLVGGDLRQTNLTGADFDFANLRGAFLTGADMRARAAALGYAGAASGNDGLLPTTGTAAASFVNAHLEGANLDAAVLSGVISDGSGTSFPVSGAYISGSDLTGAHMEHASLVGAFLSGANLSYANLRGANVAGAHLRGATLTGADFRGIGGIPVGFTANSFSDYARRAGAVVDTRSSSVAHLARSLAWRSK